MHPEDLNFDVFPKIVPARQHSAIILQSRYDHVRFQEGAVYAVTVYPFEGSREDVVTLPVRASGGALKVEIDFGGEQEYRLTVDNLPVRGRTAKSAEFRIYALEPDLYARLPLKGDFHMHSSWSDGVEAPANVAAACRRIGLDVMAVTDHGNYGGSLDAIRAFAGVDLALRIYPGEEVHAPENPIHIVNFGGSLSINDLFRNDVETYRREVQSLQESFDDLPGALRYQYAACVWVYLKIQAAGGLSIFCHPYWETQGRYNAPEALIQKHLAEIPFGALELIGGYQTHESESNWMQVARYHEERAKGRRIPIVGVSDAHGCEDGKLFGWYYTILFAPSTDLPDVIQAIRGLYAVAVDKMPDADARAHGPFRMVKYAHFLMREVFPGHDALCREEGRLMLAHLAGDPSAAGQLKALKGQCSRYLDHIWGRA